MISIRQATADDAGALSALNVAVQSVHAKAHPHLFKMPENDLFALEFMQERLAEPQTYIYIASLDDVPIGYILAKRVDRPENPFMHARKLIYVDQLSVNPDRRRLGAAKRLMDRIVELAQEHAIDSIALDTWAFNENAQSFFKSQGFTPFNIRLWRNQTVEIK
ncbi:MAG: GNAT family N-acetyltransferase [Chloroflexota bacterium]